MGAELRESLARDRGSSAGDHRLPRSRRSLRDRENRGPGRRAGAAGAAWTGAHAGRHGLLRRRGPGAVSGDLVMSRIFPAFATPQSRVTSWLASLDALDAFRAQRLVPAHGELAEGSATGQYRAYLQALRARVAELKRAGKSSDETVEAVRAEFPAKYPDWGQPLRVVAAANAIYAELP